MNVDFNTGNSLDMDIMRAFKAHVPNMKLKYTVRAVNGKMQWIIEEV